VPPGTIWAYDVDDALDAETVPRWNHLDAWLRQIEALRRVA